MKELSLNVLDIAQNSVSAGAKNIVIEINELESKDIVEIIITDDGCGMSEEFLARVTDPFTTTRTTRKVGMGIPLLKMEAEMAGGSFSIESEVGKGTRVYASFGRSNIDMPPLGDLTGTIITLVQGSPDIDFIYRRRTDKGEYEFSAAEVREALGGVPLDTPEVLVWIREYIEENESNIL